jgi:4-alpha-glucanotransferase
VTRPVDLDAWGVFPGFRDANGRWVESPPATIAAILESMGADPGAEPPPPMAITVRTDHPLPDIGAGLVRTEDGGEIQIHGNLPPDLPPGYHSFEADREPARPLIVSPGRVPLPGRPQWGFGVQLYAARSTRSWGMGDLADLQQLNRWAAGLGAGFTLVNPLHAPSPTTPVQPSPYFPGSRCFLNPLYISVEQVAGAAALPATADAARAGRALNAAPLIDRDQVWAVKLPVLEALFDSSADAAGFEEFCRRRGEALERFATYCAAAERLGPAWREWPAGAASDVDPVRKRFYMWLQWVADTQLQAADQSLGVVADLAVGVDPNGADAWIWSDAFAPIGVRIGAPPDEFNTQGQDWGLPPFDPWRLRGCGYAPWIEALRAGLAHGSGLRVDHVMGLFRLYWIPADAEARAGAYVRYPHHDMLNILALEAHRAGAYVVGEDLGTVEDGVRRDLAERQVLSYRVWWFEDRPTGEWPVAAMGAVTTHDLPTVAGVWAGSDLQAQRDIGLHPNEEASAELLEKLQEQAPGDTPEKVIAQVYEDLGRARCHLLVASIDDVLEVEERPNMPGTVEEWPNWRIALPAPLEDLERTPLAAEIARVLGRT